MVHIAWVSRRIASLQLLCRLQIQSSLSCEEKLPKLPLPPRLKSLIGNLFAQTIRVSFLLFFLFLLNFIFLIKNFAVLRT